MTATPGLWIQISFTVELLKQYLKQYLCKHNHRYIKCDRGKYNDTKLQTNLVLLTHEKIEKHVYRDDIFCGPLPQWAKKGVKDS